MTVRAIVTDIEGTTSSIDFVVQVLFPYASAALPGFVQEHGGDPAVAEILGQAQTEAGEPGASAERLVEIMQQWIAEDRKVTPLKSLQGLIWRHGYESGEFTGHVYTDAAQWLRRWADAGIRLYVYSSGSVAAQQLLFGHSDAGDLRPLFSGYFDTGVGHKREADSYRAIVRDIGLPASEILFLSDVVEELDAARVAGMQTTQLLRDAGLQTGVHPRAHAFDEVII